MSAARIVVWSDDDCRRVHQATLQVLAETGIDVRHPPALEVFAAAGGRVDGTRVRLDAAVVDKALASAPRTWTVRSRGRDKDLELRNGLTWFGTGSDCLFYRDPDSGERRRVRMADIEEMAALAEQLPHLDFVMSMGLPEDAPLAVDDLSAVAAMLAGTRKPLMVATRNGGVVRAVKDMCAAAGAPDSFMIYAMPAPPLMHDRDGLTKLAACAEHEVPIIWAAAPNAGSTGPRSIAGTAVVGNAETLGRPRLPPADPPRSALRLRRGHGRHGHAHRGRRLHHPREPARPGRARGPLPLVRAAQLQLRLHVRFEDARRAVRPRVRPHRHGRRAAARHAHPRRGLPRVGPAELVRVDRLRQRRHRLGQGLHADVPTTTRRSPSTRSPRSVRAATFWLASTRAPTRATSGTTTSSTTRSTTAGTRAGARPCSTGSRPGRRTARHARLRGRPRVLASVAEIMQAAGREREA